MPTWITYSLNALLSCCLCLLLCFGCASPQETQDASPLLFQQTLEFVAPGSTPAENEPLVLQLESDFRRFSGIEELMTQLEGEAIQIRIQFRDDYSAQASRSELHRLALAFCKQHPGIRLGKLEEAR